jgi:D-alanyl-lipoteichoic acid acyltransferase DltB (MBOAT superfamily)
VYAYAFQIYGDFSGYSDIAIGSAKMLGFELPMNFNSPYKAQNLREFWQRWHISLSTWLRDYLYIPLGGSRRGRGRTYVNLMITMVLGGLWHGAARTFVFWGLYHGILLSLTRLFQRRPGKPQMVNQSFPASVIAPFVTFHLICFGWILFRAEQFSDVPVILTRIIQSGDWSLDVAPAVLIILGLAAATHFCPPQLNKVTETIFVRLPAAAQGLIIAVAVGLFNLFGAAAHPFIYFQF